MKLLPMALLVVKVSMVSYVWKPQNHRTITEQLYHNMIENLRKSQKYIGTQYANEELMYSLYSKM